MARGPGVLVPRVFVVLLNVLAVSLPVYAALAVDPIPPFQWLNITPLLKGSTQPPGLKDAAMGYDETSHSLIIFGGEASSTVPQGQTYLLNLETLTWSIPTPPGNLLRTPPARSAAISGCDIAASNRNGFMVIGGKSSDGAALSDVWEYDFNNEFWSEVNISPGGPSPRWGSSGGIDSRVPAVPDPVLPGPNNTFWLWGGTNGQSSFSDLWRLNVSGTLSSNMPNSAVGSWQKFPLDNVPARVGQGGGVTSDKIVFSGGCDGTTMSGDSCAVQDTYTINTGSATGAPAPLKCPAPRLSPALVPNANRFSTSFSSQVLLLLGSFNTTLWDDGGGLKDGEVAVLDVNTQSWTRILPSGDPGTSGTPSFPTPREGSVAVTSPLSLVGQARTTSSDTIVFGGRDASGNYLSEVWVLRSYNGLLTPSNPKWSGFGNGQLQTGVDANGAGVENKFISSCASAIQRSPPASSPPASSTANSTSNPTSSPTTTSGESNNNTSDAGQNLQHAVLAPLSVALLMPSFLLFRLSYFNSKPLPRVWYYAFCSLGLASYSLGIGGVVTAFTTISFISADAMRPPLLSTAHGQAGLALFVFLYGLLPLLALLHASTKRTKHAPVVDSDSRASDLTEKDRMPRITHSPSPPPIRRRTHSWGPSSWRKTREDSLSIDSGSAENSLNTTPTPRGFEVLNRPTRTRRASGSVPLSSVPLAQISQRAGSHSLGDLEWLNRRRSLTAVGELNYPLNHTTATATAMAPSPSTPATLLRPPVEAPPSDIPPLSSVLLRLLFHISLLGLSVFCLVTLWSKAPKSTFSVFVAWTIAFYITLIISSWRGQPDRSTLSLLFGRLRHEPQATAHRPSVSDTLPDTDENGAAFPYLHHQPAYRRALLSDTLGPQGNTDTEEEDDDRAEDEMRRRDISFVTSYPKRELRITNPS